MYTVGIRDHILIAHSLKGEIFGPAQNMHGCTYVVDVEFRRQQLDSDGLVIDMGLAVKLVRQVLQSFNYRNLDEIQEFQGINTTTEFLAAEIFRRLAEVIGNAPQVKGICSCKITLHESHTAWASYEGALA